RCVVPGDTLRQCVPRARPLVARHDPDEEVGREEGPEDHHLGDDEEQHPEQLGLDARGAVGLRRAVAVLVVDAGVAAVGDRRGFHQAAASSRASTCWTGLPLFCSIFSTRPFSTQAERLEGRVEMTTSEMWKYWSA